MALASLTLQINSLDAQVAAQKLKELTAAGLSAQNMHLRLRDTSDQVARAEERAAAMRERAAQRAAAAQVSSFNQIMTTAMQLIGIYSLIQTTRNAFADAATEDRVTMGLQNITGSAQQAKEMITQLNDYASHSQFGIDKLENSARILANMGFAAKEVVPTLKAIGNEIEATGGQATDLDDVIKSLARMNDEGQISVFTLRQMEQQGIPAGRILATALNESIVEVMKDVRAGTLNAHTTLELLIRGMADFGNSSLHAKNSVYVLWNELQNNLRITLKNVALEFLQAFNVRVGLQNMIDGVRVADMIIKDIFTVLSGGVPKLSETSQIINTMVAALRIMAGVLAVIVALKFAAMLSAAGVSAVQLTIALSLLLGIGLVEWFGSNTDAGKQFISTLKESAEYLGLFHSYAKRMVGELFSFGSLTKMKPDEGRRMHEAEDAELSERMDAIAQRYNGHPNSISNAMGGGTGNFGSNMWDGIQKFLSSSLDLNMGKIVQQVNTALKQQNGGADNLAPIRSSSAYELSNQKAEEIQKAINKLKEEQKVAGDVNSTRKMALDIQKEEESIGQKVLEQSKQARDLLQEYKDQYQELLAMQTLGAITDGVAKSVGHAFEEFATGAKTAKQAVDDLLKSIEKLAINQFVTKPLEDMLNNVAGPGGIGGGILKALFGGGADPNMSGYSKDAQAAYGGDVNMEPGVGQALGGIWNRGVQMYADGGMVNAPTFFGMAGGNMGLMGEAGPEAIMPLSRGPDGKLGIRGGGSTTNNVQNVTMHVHANDADSFRRNSRQVRQALSRG